MVGTYLVKGSKHYPLHFLPQRVHANRSDSGILVYIPNFYNFSHLRRYLKEDFYDLKALMDRYDHERKFTNIQDRGQFGKVGTIMKKSLTMAGLPVAQRNTLIIAAMSSRWGKAHGVVKGAKDEKLDNSLLQGTAPDKRQKAIRIIDQAVNDHIRRPEDRRRWGEFCRMAAQQDEYTPFR